MPGAVNAASEQPVARTQLPIGEAQALTIIPSGAPLRSQASVLHAREPFRHTSYLSDVAVGVICGLGAHGYQLALDAALRRVGDN